MIQIFWDNIIKIILYSNIPPQIIMVKSYVMSNINHLQLQVHFKLSRKHDYKADYTNTFAALTLNSTSNDVLFTSNKYIFASGLI